MLATVCYVQSYFNTEVEGKYNKMKVKQKINSTLIFYVTNHEKKERKKELKHLKKKIV